MSPGSRRRGAADIAMLARCPKCLDLHFAWQKSAGPNRYGSKADIEVECAPDGGHLAGELTKAAGLSEDESHGQTTFHSIEFKRQVAQEFVAGETLYALAKRYDVSRNLIRVWVKKLETG